MRIGEGKVEFHLKNTMKYLPEVEDCWNITMNEDLADESMNVNYSFPTLEQFREKIRTKEGEDEKLSRNKKDFVNLMNIKKVKDINNKSNKLKQSQKKESYSFINIIVTIKGTKKIGKEWKNNIKLAMKFGVAKKLNQKRRKRLKRN